MKLPVRPVCAALAVLLCCGAAPAVAGPFTMTLLSGGTSLIASFRAVTSPTPVDAITETGSDSFLSLSDTDFSASLDVSPPIASADQRLEVFGSALITDDAASTRFDFDVGLSFTGGAPSARGSGGALVSTTVQATLDAASFVLTYELTEDVLASISNGVAQFEVSNLTTGTTLFTLTDDSTTAGAVSVNLSGSVGDVIQIVYAGVAQQNLMSGSASDRSYRHQSSFTFTASDAVAVPAPGSVALLLAGLMPVFAARRALSRSASAIPAR